MRALLAVLAAVLTLLLAPAARAQRPSDYRFQVDVDASARAWEDASALQFSITPKTRATISVRGRTLRVPVSAYTATDGGDSASALRYSKITGTAGAFVDRRLTASERRAWHSQLVWIDGDVLAVNPSNPLCTSGTTRAAAHSMLAN